MRRRVAYVIAFAVPWALFMWSNRWMYAHLDQMRISWFTVTGRVLFPLAPFGHLLQVGYDWAPHPSLGTFAVLLAIAALPQVLFAIVSGDWLAASLRRMGLVAAVWVVVSIALEPESQGLLALAMPQAASGQLGYVAGKMIAAALFMLVWAVWLAPLLLSAGARLVGGMLQRTPGRQSG
jgi:hypothetical protein